MPVHSSPRQQRGQRRIASLLTAAERVFAEAGYENATTNQIAERAGASPGTLYQFFPNKLAIAECLASQYAREMSDLCDALFHRDHADRPLQVLIDRSIDALISFHQQHPAFQALFVASQVSPHLHLDITGRIVDRLAYLIRARSPRHSKSAAGLLAETCVVAFRGFLPAWSAKPRTRRAPLVKEVKTMLERYLEPVVGS